MTTLSKLIVALAIMSHLIIPGSAWAIPEYRGMSYVGWSADELATEKSEQSIAAMKAIGVDTVALNVFWFQPTRTASGPIQPDYHAYSASEQSVERAIDNIHSQGMKVLLKPNLDIRHPETGEWRGLIEPTNPTEWFENYEKFVLTFAQLAEKKKVEIFSIGTELNGLEQHELLWRQLISRTRTTYHGKLIYSANHSDAGSIGGGYQAVGFWDALDYIGIDAYYTLVYSIDPTAEELQRRWQQIGDEIESWRENRKLTQPVIFTEVGYRSLNGAVMIPWNYQAGGEVDFNEQAAAYQSLLATFYERPWWAGAMWWYWSTDPMAGGQLDAGFTPARKPAQQVLQNYYLPVTGSPINQIGGQALPARPAIDNLDWLAAVLGGKYVMELIQRYRERQLNLRLAK